jgi:transposase
MGHFDIRENAADHRRFSDAEKRALVAAAFAPGAVVCDVARRASIRPNQIYRWRRRFQNESCGFTPVIAPTPPLMTALTDESAPAPTVVVEMMQNGGFRLQMPPSTPPTLASSIIGALRTS